MYPMRSILRSTAILSSSSIVSILISLVSAKAWAVLVGPGGLGFLGLLTSLAGIAGIIAGMGIGAGLVCKSAHALAQEDHHRVGALVQATRLLSWGLGAVAMLTLIIFRIPISQLVLGGQEHAVSVVLIGLSLLFNLAGSMQTSILNAHHRVGALAKIGILNSLLGVGISLVFIWLWREQGIAPGIVGSAAVSWATSWFFLRREVNLSCTRPSHQAITEAAWSLLRFGGPYTASQLVGTGVQLALPLLVFYSLDQENVGFYRAAVAVANGYLGFLLIAMGQDYYPRVSASRDRPDELIHLVNQQHRLVMLLAVPIILGTLALAPYLVPVIYSPQFAPTIEVLEWLLIGDLFKFSSWTMGYVILAQSGSITLFLVELIAGVNILAFSWLGMLWFGIEGLGIAFLATYLLHYVIVWIIVRREIGLVWTIENKRRLLIAVLAALVIRVLPFTGLQNFRSPVALTLAVLIGVGSLYTIWQEIGRVERVHA